MEQVTGPSVAGRIGEKGPRDDGRPARPRGTGTVSVGGHDLVGTTPDGAATVVDLRGAGTTLLAFLSADCLTCAHFWQELGSARAEDLLPSAHLVLVAGGRGRADPAAVKALAPSNRTTIISQQAWEDYGVLWSPYFVLVEDDSTEVVAEGTASTWEQLVTLVTRRDGPASVEEVRGDEFIPRSWLDPRAGIEASATGPSRLVTSESIDVGQAVIIMAGMHVTPTEADAVLTRNDGSRVLVLDDDVRLLQLPDDPACLCPHSCDPNLWLDGPFSLVARRRIETGEQLTLDLGTVIVRPRLAHRVSLRFTFLSRHVVRG